VLFLLGLVMVGFLVVVWGLGRPAEEEPPPVEPPHLRQDREPGGDPDRDRGPRDGGARRGGQQAAAGEAAPWDRNVP
jgi:hypothetical protein